MLLMIDNYDSFTYNLLHYFGELGAKVEVVRNDKITPESVLARTDLEGVVISPGPCDPDRAGVCLELIERVAGTLPILGVCLGHQAIGQVFGAKVVRAPVPVHGKVSVITHTGSGVFSGVPSPLAVTRYHSLILERETLPDCLAVTAETEDGIIMGIEHKDYPLYGVQFHPESIASDGGKLVLGNFLFSTSTSISD